MLQLMWRDARGVRALVPSSSLLNDAILYVRGAGSKPLDEELEKEARQLNVSIKKEFIQE